MEHSRDFESLLIETQCLMREYAKIHYDIQSNAINFPACWEALIPLKTEYFKALSHVYVAKSMAKSKNETSDEKNRLKTMKAHLQASQSSHEEILRLQRMCRELRVSLIVESKSCLQIMQCLFLLHPIVFHNSSHDTKQNKIKISKVLHDLEECIVNEMYTIPENINDDEGEIIDTTIKEMQSKYNLANTAPDFGKVDDPFRELGPITVFSARRSWTAPRSIRLHKTDYQTKSCGTEEFGFSLKGDAPVMISHVDINSVADVSSALILSRTRRL